MTILIGLGLCLGLLSALGPVTTASGQSVDGETAAFERLAACSRDRGLLQVLLLMDESGSLQSTDPNDRRVIAAQAAVLSLASLGDDPAVSVEVALSSFAVDFARVTEWSTLDSSTVDRFMRDVTTFEERNRGLDTDFYNAYAGVRDEFSRRLAETSADGGARACQLLLMFTDGDYDVEPRARGAGGQRGQDIVKVYAPDLPLDQPGNAALVEERGRQLLCEGGGLIDELRQDDVVTVTLALEEDIDPDARNFLRAMTTGEASGVSCGDLVGPRYGVYIPATDLAELIAGFNRAANEIAGGTAGFDEPTLPVCDARACPEGSRTFELSPAYDYFHLLAHTAAQPVVVELASPGGTAPLVLTSGQSGRYELGSVVLDVVWLSPQDVAIDGQLSPDTDDWVGTWTMTFIDPTGQHAGALASVQLYLFGGLTPELVDEPFFRMGEVAEARIRIVDAVGTPRTPTDFVQQATVSAEVTDPVSGRTHELAVDGPAGDGTYVATWPVPSDIEAATVNLTVRLDIIAQSGIALRPRTRTFAVAIHPPATYPSVGPADLRLSSISGRSGEAVGTIVLAGPAEGSGCVWFEGVGVQRNPRNAGEISPSMTPEAMAQVDCLALGPGERREVELRVAVGQVASGGVEGRIVARLASDASPDVLSAELPFAFDMHRPVDQVRRAALFVALLLIGLLLPLVVLWLLNWWGARYEPLARLRTAAVPVRVTPDGRLRRVLGDQEQPLSFSPEDFKNTPGPNAPVREASIDGLELASKVPLFPFRPAYGVARRDAVHVIASDGMIGRGEWIGGKVPFNLSRQWIFELGTWDVPEDGEPDVRGTLRTFLPEGPMHRQIGDLVDELNRTVPAGAQRLAREADKRAPAEPSHDDPGVPQSPTEPGDEGWSPSRRRGRPGAPQPPNSSAPDTGTPRQDNGPGTPGGWQPPQR